MVHHHLPDVHAPQGGEMPGPGGWDFLPEATGRASHSDGGSHEKNMSIGARVGGSSPRSQSSENLWGEHFWCFGKEDWAILPRKRQPNPRTYLTFVIGLP